MGRRGLLTKRNPRRLVWKIEVGSKRREQEIQTGNSRVPLLSHTGPVDGMVRVYVTVEND